LQIIQSRRWKGRPRSKLLDARQWMASIQEGACWKVKSLLAHLGNMEDIVVIDRVDPSPKR